MVRVGSAAPQHPHPNSCSVADPPSTQPHEHDYVPPNDGLDQRDLLNPPGKAMFFLSSHLVLDDQSSGKCTLTEELHLKLLVLDKYEKMIG